MKEYLDDDERQEYRHGFGLLAEKSRLYREALLEQEFPEPLADQLVVMWARTCITNGELVAAYTRLSQAVVAFVEAQIGEMNR